MSEEKIQNSQFAKRNTSQSQPHPNNNSRSQNNQNSSGGKPNYNSPNKSYPRFSSNYPNNSQSSKQPALFCKYCKATGHEIKDCELRIANNNRRNQKPGNGNYSYPNRVSHVVEHIDEPDDEYPIEPESLNE
ncbi:unnamed protein product [Pieris macdunnoughi]|uniref:Uncharacterized protein n=1 Tax=Pieris macdunnoughi TaxID=345717 RepID=A0A821T6G7_9NEOP|nr:unnamed protein product [Pieris macdunnoughi]